MLQARDGLEAVELLRTQPIACLLVDLMMPRMTGEELLQQIHAAQLEVPTIVMSDDCGFTQTPPGYPLIGCLQKPFSLHELAALLPGRTVAES